MCRSSSTRRTCPPPRPRPPPAGGNGSSSGGNPPPDTDDTKSGPPPVSRVDRSPAVKHKIHQINLIHKKNEDSKKHPVTSGTHVPKTIGNSTPHHPVTHAARKK